MTMTSLGIKDILSSFSPCSDLFAVASTDGRIKIWDALKGQMQAEFSDFRPISDGSELLSGSKKGHLSLEHKCMKWVQLESKKKKKHKLTLLVVGTGSGDVLAVEVSTGQLRWRVCDCHSGGVSAIALSRNNSFLYTSGLDGIVCQIDCSIGSIIMKFKPFTKGISTLAISSDGNKLAAAAGMLKIFDCTDNKRIQKFSGHPVSVRCMIFSEDGKYILTSGVGERHIAIWKIDGLKKKSASCVLSMEHPAIFLDSLGSDEEGSKVQGFYVLAVSEAGVCYFWFGNSIEELQNARPSKISLAVPSTLSKRNKNQTIFAAKLDGIVRSASGSMRFAHGSLIKPSFEKLIVKYGVDISLNTSTEGVLFPVGQSLVAKEGRAIQASVTTLDCANAEDAIFPIPKLHASEKKRKHGSPFQAVDFVKAKLDLDARNRKSSFSLNEGQMQRMDVDEPMCIEDRLRTAGLLDSKDKIENFFSNGHNDITMYENLDFTVDTSLPRRKIRKQISAMSAVDACGLLKVLVSSWKSRSASSKHLLPWIYYILVVHGQFFMSHDSSSGILGNLKKLTELKPAATHSLLKLSGTLQLIMTQIGRSGRANQTEQSSSGKVCNGSDEEEEDDDGDVDEVIYGEDDELEEDDEEQSGSSDD